MLQKLPPEEGGSFFYQIRGNSVCYVEFQKQPQVFKKTSLFHIEKIKR